MELKQSHVKRVLNDGGTCFGTMLRMVKAPEVISLSAAAGWDYVVLDTEHRDFNSESLKTLALIAKYEKLGFLVRVPDKLYHQMAHALDLGAEGLVLPRVDTEEEARHIIKSTKYFPLGQRGASISNISTLFRDCSAEQFLDWSNNETLIVVQIETEEAVNRVDSIVSVEGVDAVMIGPFDLSQSLGIPGQTRDPRVEDAFRAVIEACNRHGVAPGVHLTNLEDAKRWASQGMRFITFQYDSQYLLRAFRETVAQLKQFA